MKNTSIRHESVYNLNQEIAKRESDLQSAKATLAREENVYAKMRADKAANDLLENQARKIDALHNFIREQGRYIATAKYAIGQHQTHMAAHEATLAR